jgi:uncharacterized CHY-type Zn-finger protein
LAKYEGVLFPRHVYKTHAKWILPLGVYHRTHRHNGLLFCPSCLRQDAGVPYFRTYWRLALAMVCPYCQCLLQDSCPSCGAPVIFFRIDLGRKMELPDLPLSCCYRCHQNLSQSPVIPAPGELLGIQAEIIRTMREGWKKEVPYPHLYFSVLQQLVKILCSKHALCTPLQRALDEQLDPIIPRIVDKASLYASTFELLPLPARRVILQQAVWLLTEWPGRFVGFMKQHQVASTPLLRDFANIPFWYESVVTDHLYVNNVNRRFASFWS